MFRASHDGDEWICRCDPGLRRPFLSPEVVLLFKAGHRRPKDLADLAAALPVVDGPRRTWLREALDLVHPATCGGSS